MGIAHGDRRKSALPPVCVRHAQAGRWPRQPSPSSRVGCSVGALPRSRPEPTALSRKPRPGAHATPLPATGQCPFRGLAEMRVSQDAHDVSGRWGLGSGVWRKMWQWFESRANAKTLHPCCSTARWRSSPHLSRSTLSAALSPRALPRLVRCWIAPANSTHKGLGPHQGLAWSGGGFAAIAPSYSQSYSPIEARTDPRGTHDWEYDGENTLTTNPR